MELLDEYENFSDQLAIDAYYDDHDNFTSKRFSKYDETVFKDLTISFGFLDSNLKRFFTIEELKNSKGYIEKSTNFVIRTGENVKKYSYNLRDNIPYVLKIMFQEPDLSENNLGGDPIITIILIFRISPKIYDEDMQIPAKFLLDNYNRCNNLLNLDSPYRCLKVSVSPSVLANISTKLYLDYHYKQVGTMVVSSQAQVNYTLEDYVKYINCIPLRQKFEDNYTIFVNISLRMGRKAYASALEELTQLTVGEVDMKDANGIMLNSYSKDIIPKAQKDTNNDGHSKESFFIIKRVQISPSFIKYKKEVFHQSSRFLRKYFHMDNFIKVEFISEYGNQLYTNDPKYQKLSLLYKTVFENGLILANKSYEFFLITTSAMRCNSMWMISKESPISKYELYNDLGLPSLISQKSICFAKLIARLSQNFTTTVPFGNQNDKLLTILEEDDIYTTDRQYCYSDGCGRVSLDYLNDVCFRLNKGEFASTIQIRFQGAKGVLVIDPTLKERTIVFTKSMVKFRCHNSTDLEVIRFSKYSQGYLNLQIIILLILNGVKKQTIYRYAKKEVSNIVSHCDIESRGNLLKVLAQIDKDNKLLIHSNDFLTKSAKSCFIYNKLSNLAKKYRIEIKKSSFLIGVLDFRGILKENEVFVQICKPGCKKKIISGTILVTKNPCISLYDIQQVKAAGKDDLNSEDYQYFKEFFFNVIVFPMKGDIPLPNKISGSDLDGDVYWTCWEKQFFFIKQRDYRRKHLMRKIEIDPSQVNSFSQIPPSIPSYTIIQPTGVDSLSPKKLKKIRNLEIPIKVIKFKPSPGLSFEKQSLELFLFFHENYKLPSVSRNILIHSNELMKDNNYTDLGYHSKRYIEELAYHHSIEVDFQKTGETSIFKEKKGLQPSFLKKNKINKKLNYFQKLGDLFFHFQLMNSNGIESEDEKTCDDDKTKVSSLSCNVKSVQDTMMSFYSFLIKTVNECKDVYHPKQKYLRPYQIREKNEDMRKRSFIYKIYELVSFDLPMHKAFLESISVCCEEFFYENNLQSLKFSISPESMDELKIKILAENVKRILKYFQNEIKYIMMENDIIHEVELMYMIEYIDPKVEIYKNDVEEWKINLQEQTNFVKNKCLKELAILSSQSSFTDIQQILYILTFWIQGKPVSVNNIPTLVFDDLLSDPFSIKTKSEFIETLVEMKEQMRMKYYYYERLKIISLYNLFSNQKN